ncbi:ricin-type beta-trefoil lectin domain protein [Actinoplanes sp. NPDC049548]|uniref:ricin-type beta-trefoil lectin domain protein n=1 Tax=Actinoplanes sp. NPDC049548 TaxID=3155152 RepID=UPI00342DB50D
MLRRLLLALALAALAALACPSPVDAAPSAAPVKFYVVRDSYDGEPEFLFEIAERFLGSGDRNHEIFELNEGRLQPDGQRTTDPDTILPGWVLQLPPDAKGEGVRTGALPTPVVTPSLGPSVSPLPAAAIPVRHSGPQWWKWALLATGGVLLLGCAVAAWWWWLRRPPERTLSPAALWTAEPQPTGRRPVAVVVAGAVLAIAALAAGAVSLVATDPPSAVAAPPPAYPSSIVANDPTLCLAANTPTDGAPLVLKRCDGGAAQQWQAPGDGTLRAAGQCMDVAGAETALGTPLQLATCNDNRAQLFRLDDGRLVSLLTGECVDVRGARVAVGVSAIVQPCASVADRTWRRPS